MRAHYDPKTGAILGFYRHDIHGEIPDPSIAIDAADWQAHVDGTSRKCVDVLTGELVDYIPPEKSAAEIIAEREAAARAECRRRIAARAPLELQVNIALGAAVAAATPKQAASAKALAEAAALRGWVAAMAAAAPEIAADPAADIHDDGSWPEFPAEAAGLIATP